MKYRIKRFLPISDIKKIDDDYFKFFLGYFNIDGHKLEGNESVLYLLSLLNGDNSLELIIKKIMDKYSNVTKEEIIDCIDIFKKEGIIEDSEKSSNMLSALELERYNRHILFYSMFLENEFEAQEKLKNAKVVLLGMGGIGCWVSYSLAGAGIGTIIGVDNDTIESSNLTRQILYSESDIGKYKVDIAADRLSKYNSLVKFIPIKEIISSTHQVEEIIKDCDFVIFSADQPSELHQWVNEACIKQNIAYSNVGYVNYFAVCGPMMIPGNQSSKFSNEIKEDLLKQETQCEYAKDINKNYQPPSFGPINGIISCYQTMEVIKYLTGYAEPKTINKRFVLDTYTMDATYQEF